MADRVWGLSLVLAASAIAGSLLWTASSGCGRDGEFCPLSCERLESSLSSNIVGQELALSQVVSAVCDHVRKAVRKAYRI